MRTARSRVLLVLLVTLALATGPTVAAAETRSGGTVVVESDETVRNLTAFGGTVIVRGTVQGDLDGFAGTVVIERSGVVTGNLSAAAGTVRIGGEVQGSVDAGAGAVYLDRNGVVRGGFDVGAESVVIDGQIDGPAVVGAESITVGSTAVLGSGLRYDAENFSLADGATVEGEVVRDRSIGQGDERDDFLAVPDVLGFGYGVLANLLLGAVLLLVFPGSTGRIADAVADSPLKSGGVGIAALIGTPILLVLVAVTVVGIPLALAGIALFAILLWVAYVYGRYAVAAWALSKVGVESRWVALTVGVVGFAVLTVVPILGGLLNAVLTLLGFGALVLTLFGLRRLRGGGRETRQSTLDEVESA